MNAKASVQKPIETVDGMRQRAKYRLIGAVVLVLAGVVGFPMLFDSQPRPVAVDVSIEIPDKTKVRPLGAPPLSAPAAAPAAPAVAAKVEDSASLSGKEEIVSSAKVEAKASDKSKDDANKAAADKASADKLAAEKTRKLAEEDKAKKLKAQIAEKTAADKIAESTRAKALLNGAAPPPKPVAAAATPAAAGDTRYIVQFGAFSEVAKAQEARRKVEKAGLKTYSQIAKTADGDRIRVRVGPFTSKDEADKAASKIKALDLPASILTL